MDVLVTYDIDTTTTAGARRLVRVAHVCERFGVRVQYSVFECRLLPARYARLIEELRGEIDRSLDSIHFYRFDGSLKAARTSLGRNDGHRPGQPWIV